MKKSILILSISFFALASCQKEEVTPEPNPVPPVNTSFDITKTIADASGTGANYVTVSNLNNQFIDYNCYAGTQVTLTTGNSYNVTLTNSNGTVTKYTGTISVDSGGNLTITDGAVTTVHLYHQSCSSEPYVLVFN